MAQKGRSRRNNVGWLNPTKQRLSYPPPSEKVGIEARRLADWIGDKRGGHTNTDEEQ